MAAAELKERIRRWAEAEGFDAVGFTTPDAIPEASARLAAFIADDRQGDMAWMRDTAERRGDPRRLWPEMRSIIMLGKNYGPDESPLARLDDHGGGVISVYALGSDYHELIKKRLKAVARTLVRETGAEVKVFVDTAPLMEKPLAEAAGLGWQGKHTNLVSREFGSWLFLGAIATTAEIAPDTAGEDRCGSCRACLDICPTRAFPAPYQLDARRCISYLTIEHKGHIPLEFRAPIGNRIFGCDDCLAVCPWNKFARQASDAKLQARPHLRNPRLKVLAELDDAGFRAMFAGTPVRRAGRNRFIRNVLIAIGNSGDPALVPTVRERLQDPSPLVRAMAIWALRKLVPPDEFAALAAALAPAETDLEVAAEWRLE
ncbi:tRNA epoxyqueuosine(34) reductase QueG [Rhodoligotrophos defluvii]|uniref:tRNA epoxyqueuosine(34) reductase QueG n=1 Tax=Rhodoligotrophos defluvii TaxID=2561934 RepID=UPI0010C9E523|nr:tRNA epoxyqueuosine(34) reductase QueG [Rhodoligotrophos defluvii]